MVFHSAAYLVFFLIVFTACRLLPLGPQNWFLLGASLVFYGWVHPVWAGLLLFTSMVDFSAARGMARHPQHKRRLLILSAVSNLGVLCTFKYFDFFSTAVADALGAAGWSVNPLLLGLALPAGISFYTFQSLSYVVDVYRGDIPARRSLRDYLLFTSFFPQLVAGPIERAGHLLSQIERPRLFDVRIARSAVLLILWGFVKKLVIADNAAPVANRIFALESPSFPVLWAGVFAFGVQIYADFSGYTDIARGSARLLGFDICRNFNHPWLADSPANFWQRWHISLSRWFRDYVYIPLGGNRHRHLRNLALTFLLSGFWHGAAWNFILWGAWHGLLLIAWQAWSRGPARLGPERLPRMFRIVLVFVLVHIGWLFFREHSLPHLWRHLTTSPLAASATDWHLGLFCAAQVALFALPLALHIALDRWLVTRAATTARTFTGWRWSLAMTVLAALLWCLLLLYRNPTTSDFIYFAF